jgi:hypothetical protein
MKYALYVVDGKKEVFLDAASEVAYLKKDRNGLLRLMDRGCVVISDPEDAHFVIYQDGHPHLKRGYAGVRHGAAWKSPTTKTDSPLKVK